MLASFPGGLYDLHRSNVDRPNTPHAPLVIRKARWCSILASITGVKLLMDYHPLHHKIKVIILELNLIFEKKCKGVKAPL